jgi:tryptophan synthase alpha chain
VVGDPDFATTRRLLAIAAGEGVDAVELCVPFENAFTDGPVVRRGYARALPHASPGRTLEFVAGLEAAPPIVLLADHAETVRPFGLRSWLQAARDAGCAATLLHGLPPFGRGDYIAASGEIGIGTVLSCYLTSPEPVRASACRDATSFVYIVSGYGRSGGAISFDADRTAALAAIRRTTEAPLAVGFGIKTPDAVAAVRRAGMDLAIVGSTVVEVIERGRGDLDGTAAAFRGLVRALRVAAAGAPDSFTARPRATA